MLATITIKQFKYRETKKLPKTYLEMITPNVYKIKLCLNNGVNNNWLNKGSKKPKMLWNKTSYMKNHDNDNHQNHEEDARGSKNKDILFSQQLC